MKVCLIQQTSAYFVSFELTTTNTVLKSSNADIFSDFHNCANLTDLSTKCLTKSASIKNCKLFICFACKANYPKSDLFAYITQSSTEIVEDYFELAFYKVEWRQLAKDFYHENTDVFLIVPRYIF